MSDPQTTGKRQGAQYEGYDAFKAGLRYEDCPYPYTGQRNGSDWWKWTAGWTLAKHAAERAKDQQ